MSELSSICVYCGSSPSNQPSFMEAARTLGQTLGGSNIRLVYGGASIGIMGAIADATLSANGTVLGVMPDALVEREVQHEGLTELIVVPGMHERKAKMVEESDGFIAIPGGFGTLDELFETLTWAQLGYHSKPVGLLNVEGYFDGLLVFLEHAVEKALIKQNHLDMLLVDANINGLLEKMRAYTPKTIDKLK